MKIGRKFLNCSLWSHSKWLFSEPPQQVFAFVFILWISTIFTFKPQLHALKNWHGTAYFCTVLAIIGHATPEFGHVNISAPNEI